MDERRILLILHQRLIEAFDDVRMQLRDPGGVTFSFPLQGRVFTATVIDDRLQIEGNGIFGLPGATDFYEQVEIDRRWCSSVLKFKAYAATPRAAFGHCR